jgi:D-aminoacyl-tRNA deacylase
LICLIQHACSASVVVNHQTIGAIDRGLLLFVCAERGDTQEQANRLLAKVLSYRVFPDDAGKMNLNVAQVNGGLLIVSQFTLAADTSSGTRPSFSPAAEPVLGRQLYEHFVAQAKAQHPVVATGEFGADMQVSLVNDGPVTFWLRVPPAPAERDLH